MLSNTISKREKNILMYIVVLSACLIQPVQSLAGGGGGYENFALYIAWIAIMLLVGKVGSLVEKFGQPAVLGELLAGMLLGNLGLLGITYFEPIHTSEVMKFLAEIGVIVLLFQVGLESNLDQMKRVGIRAFSVAIVGVILPFLMGWALGPYILPGLSNESYIFLGAVLTATSVGITARVFRDMNSSQIPEAQIVLGAAVIDDVLGLIILAVVQALIQTGSLDIGIAGVITLKALAFLMSSLLIGRVIANPLSKLLSRINTSVSMKFTFAIVFCLTLSYLASLVGLATIVGAFSAGLILDAVHFRFYNEPHFVKSLDDAIKDSNEPESALASRIRSIMTFQTDKHIDELIEPLSFFFVPLFFVITGFAIDIRTFTNPHVVIGGLIITLIAVVGKIASGLAAGKVRKLIVGVGMIPRGEVGLIFATVGMRIGAVNNEEYSQILMMVILTTLLTPPILTWLLRKG
jgi:Kef-type K+ transport system membrane component KefB